MAMATNAMMPDDGTWRTSAFRQNMVSKIDEAIIHCGAPTTKNAAEMENQVYSKANSKNEYLSFVARLIIHIKDMGSKSKMGGGGGGPPMQGQPNQSPGPGGQIPGQMSGNQPNNMGMMGPMNPMGVNVMNPQNMQNQMQQQQIGQGMQPGMSQPQQPGGMNMPQQQSQQNQNIQMNQGQMQQPQNNMMNPNFMGQQMQNPPMSSGQQGQMQQNPGIMSNPQMQQMGHPQMQQQMQNAQMQQALLQQQQQQGNQPQNQPPQQMNNPQQGMMPRGLSNAQMVQGRMMGPQQPMSAHLSQIAHQRKVGHRQMGPGPNAMGIPRPEHGPNYSMNRLNYYGANMAQVDNPVVNQYPGVPGGSPLQRPPVSGPFIPPNASQMPMGPSASPNPMSVSGPVQNQPGFVNSPQAQNIMHGSPGPAAMRSFGNQMIPSPNTNLNTPMPMVPTPSPRNAEDQACIEKIRELKKYTDLLQRMIAKIGNEDMEKSSKMKKLLDILTSPNQRVSMEILLKCEAALKKMEKQQHDLGGSVAGPPSQPLPTKDQISPFQQVQDAILTTLKNGSSSHTFLRTFRPTVEALTGQSAGGLKSPDDSDAGFDGDPKSDIPWVLRRELKLLDSRFHVKINKSKDRVPLQLIVSLSDPKLPRVPPLKIQVPNEYPDDSPSVSDLRRQYRSTKLLSSVAHTLKSHLLYLPMKFTVLELCNSWEMSVRQVSNPFHPYKPMNKKKITGRGRLAFSFL